MSGWHFTYWESWLSIAIIGFSVLPGSYALAQVTSDTSFPYSSSIATTDNLKITTDGTQVDPDLLSNLSQSNVLVTTNTYFSNADSININNRHLLITDNGSISINPANVIPVGGTSIISHNPTDVISPGSGGNISITVSSLLLTPRSVPESTFTLSTLVSVAFFGAWKLKRK